MPTISQLPTVSAISAADILPISQGGTTSGVPVGTLLNATQPAISIGSPSLLGRSSIGPGAPEQIVLGPGLSLIAGTLTAQGVAPATFPVLSALTDNAQLVITEEGNPMLMPASLLTGLFTAGQNVTISPSGTISVAGVVGQQAGTGLGSSIAELAVVTNLSGQDLVAASRGGSDCAISYANLIDGITIDQAQAAGPASNGDTLWVAQGGNVMSSQTFGAIWSWIMGNLPSYKAPVVEITASTNLDTTIHNGRLLICSQPVTLTPLATNMGNGFRCTVVNASSGSVALGSGFITSSGSMTIAPSESATLFCGTYSGGTLLFAAMSGATSTTQNTAAIPPPGAVTGLSAATVTASSLSISWEPPVSGTGPFSYVVQYCQSGSPTWTTSAPISGATSFQITGLQASTSYNVVVQAMNATGSGPVSAIMTASTATAATQAVPLPVIGSLAANATSSSTVALTWTTSGGAANSYTAEYAVSGSSTWTTLSGLTGTSTTVSGLSAATSYQFTVTGINTAGTGPTSSMATATTSSAAQSVTSITWNVTPSGSYVHGTGAIGVNAQVSPASSSIQFGFSTSNATPPTSWTAAILVNTNLWGAYVNTPGTPGTWYIWAEGVDGSALTVYPTPFTVT